jgi:hypothetical protein
MAPQIRRDAARQFVSEQHIQEQGGRYDYNNGNGVPSSEQSKNYTNEQMSYTR